MAASHCSHSAPDACCRRRRPDTQDGSRASHFSADGYLLATTGDDDYVNLSNLGTGRLLGRLAGHTAPATGAVFSADNSSLYTSSLDENVIGWDITHLNNLGQQLLAPGYGPNQAPVTFIAVSPTGEHRRRIRRWHRAILGPVVVTRRARRSR